ncbi:MAG: HPr family phosphocarrier protein [Xanthomonadales bacterium]|nr:HPr family phosphocarrier protein [Xanthomonadales bacterium]NIN59054.1 HPr family phosphocarrier protein [Xanthomonadales bacterium]NIN74358.1 HPr family phosphocarrier protein [Xanthomonadales bacterium]NIO13943.1 HPr family phosphocarrier protein [Xanthomonadales bacterium]NIP11447.1 HPr family phosphocarrier protein [Xanthomonadales bacterium]
MPARQVTIRNDLGLHARAATRLVECANRFRCDVWLENAERRVDGKSIMGVLMLAAGPGMNLMIETRGNDGQLALTALCELIESGFGEPEI